MQSKWTYEPFDVTADDFNSKVGRVLNRGAYTVGSSACFVWPALYERCLLHTCCTCRVNSTNPARTLAAYHIVKLE